MAKKKIRKQLRSSNVLRFPTGRPLKATRGAPKKWEPATIVALVRLIEEARLSLARKRNRRVSDPQAIAAIQKHPGLLAALKEQTPEVYAIFMTASGKPRSVTTIRRQCRNNRDKPLPLAALGIKYGRKVD
jgi:hypothetical protein